MDRARQHVFGRPDGAGCVSQVRKSPFKDQRAELMATVASVISDGSYRSQEKIDTILNGEY